jgi:hypothetical protein
LAIDWNLVSQIMIPILGLLSIFFLGCKKIRLVKFGFMFGLLAEPFWFYAAYTHQQWGVLLIVCAYFIGHSRGLFNSYMREVED